MINGKTILITGGTGSFGNKLTETILTKYKPKKVLIFSRDEFKQYEMAKEFPTDKYPIRYFLGDVRDQGRLNRAFEGVNYVVHAAALKQVPALEYNPMEAVKTNILGADNIVEAAIDQGVEKVIALSTDKASNPINLYGATKLAAEKVFVAANAYAGGRVKFCVVRYGNVMGSRGSVIPLFRALKEQGAKEFPITDERMTRFWITLEQSVDLVMNALNFGAGGECFVPIIPSMHLVDLARAIDPQAKFKVIGIRPGEKLHESLISEDEGYNTKIYKNMYVILPQFFENKEIQQQYASAKKVSEGFIYRSDLNKEQLTVAKLKEIISKLPL
jgi:UDP-N-acetylglucosamine 4,6-dehydratase